MLGQGRCGDQPQKTLNGWKQQRPTQGNYCWSNSTRMGAADPGSLPNGTLGRYCWAPRNTNRA